MSKQNIYLGVDIGATKTIFLLVEINGIKYKILESARKATPKREVQILKMIDEHFKILSKENKISALGIGFAGPVDFERGIAIAGPNLKTGKIEFKKILEKRLNIPIAAENDARCFVLAESAFGKAKKYKNIVGLAIGTGIGAGLIIEGKVYRGARGSAGEFGHTDILKGKELEETASATGLVKVYKKISKKKADSFKIIELARKKDKDAVKAVKSCAESLGTGIANIIESYNPEIIILGGGLSEVAMIMDKAKEYMKKKVFLPSLAKTPIVLSNLGQNAVALGAAWIAKEIKK